MNNNNPVAVAVAVVGYLVCTAQITHLLHSLKDYDDDFEDDEAAGDNNYTNPLENAVSISQPHFTGYKYTNIESNREAWYSCTRE